VHQECALSFYVAPILTHLPSLEQRACWRSRPVLVDVAALYGGNHGRWRTMGPLPMQFVKDQGIQFVKVLRLQQHSHDATAVVKDRVIQVVSAPPPLAATGASGLEQSARLPCRPVSTCVKRKVHLIYSVLQAHLQLHNVVKGTNRISRLQNRTMRYAMQVKDIIAELNLVVVPEAHTRECPGCIQVSKNFTDIMLDQSTVPHGTKRMEVVHCAVAGSGGGGGLRVPVFCCVI